jgi:hypothetical protein
VIELFPGRLIAEALIARFVTVIELSSVPITEPLVLRASEDVPEGAISAVTLIVPEFEPPTAPILKTPAVIRFSSALVRESYPVASFPKSI